MISLYLSRILSGTYIFEYGQNIYKLIYPNVETKYRAEIYAQQEYEKNKFNDWINENEVQNILINLGLWSHSQDQEFKNIQEKIENTKVELYNNFLNPKKIKSLKKSLRTYQTIEYKLNYNKHYLDSFTHKGYVNELKNQYLLINSLYLDDGSKVFNNKNVDYYLLNNLANFIGQNQINISDFRTIARHEQWRNYWIANKNNIFNSAVADWTDEQRTLVVFTKMYDSAYENPNCPPDSVIQDDDIFDGWLIIQRKESEKNKEKQRAEQFIKDKKLGNAKEVFVMADSKEEAQSIYKLNNASSMHIIKERNNIIKHKKELKESELPDVQRDLQVQSNQQFKNRR